MPLPLVLPFLAAVLQPSPLPSTRRSDDVYVTAHAGIPFISPMGEPIRARTPTDDALARWFYQADRNHDGYLTPDEMVADAERFFAILDTNHDGQIDPDEIVHYEWQMAPEIQVNSRLRRPRGAADSGHAQSSLDWQREVDSDDDRSARRRKPDPTDEGPQGAGRYALLDMPEPVAAADADLNRAVTLQEFRQAALDRFHMLDKKNEGRLTLRELEAMKPILPGPGHHLKHRKDELDPRVGVPLPPGD